MPARRNETLKALATFGGIALATGLSLDLLITSGLQFGPDEPAPDIAPFAYAQSESVHDLYNPAPNAYVQTVSWMTQYPLDVEAVREEQLAGSPNGAQVGHAVYMPPSEDDLYREIAALYAAQDARAEARAAERNAYDEAPYDDAPALEYENAAPIDDAVPVDDQTEKTAEDDFVMEAYETASPS